MKKILILGATSAIAEQLARLFAADEVQLLLVARNEQRLQQISQDLKVRGAKQADYLTADLNNTDEHASLLDSVGDKLDGLDTVIIAYGTLGNQADSEKDYQAALQELQTNCLSVISLLTHVANRFAEQKSGSIVVMSSPAGDRGRQSNYIYGTAKGALSIYLQGLRNRLHKSGVHVLTVKPGFVDTPMTADFKKGLLWVGPQTIAQGIFSAINKRKDIVYLPFFWRYIMLIIKLIPERFFKKLSL